MMCVTLKNRHSDLLYSTLIFTSLGNAVIVTSRNVVTFHKSKKNNFISLPPKFWEHCVKHTVVKINPLWCHKDHHSLQWGQQRRLGTWDKHGLPAMFVLYVFLEHISKLCRSFFVYLLAAAVVRRYKAALQNAASACICMQSYTSGWTQREISSPSIFGASMFKTTSACGRRGSPVALADARE